MRNLILISFILMTSSGFYFVFKKIKVQPFAIVAAQQKVPSTMAPTNPSSLPEIPSAINSPTPALPNLPTPPVTPPGNSADPSGLDSLLPPVQDSGSLKPQDLDPSLKFVNTEGFTYDPTGRRDPFRPYLLGLKKEDIITDPNQKTVHQIPSYLRPNEEIGTDSLESIDVSQFKLIGIMWEIYDPKAMVRSPSGKVYMIRKQTRIGKSNGYVASIREGEVVVVELATDGRTSNTRVLTLQK